MRAYADTNFLISLYLEVGDFERATATVTEAQIQGMETLPISPLLAIEMTNAFQLHVHHSHRQGQWRVAPELAGAVQAMFEEDLRSGMLYREEEMPWAPLRAAAQELAHRHTAKHGFRTYDLLHVATARLLGCDFFWSFDHKARKLATLEGLKVNSL
jgi:predicted nucleic acid-binding protein